jgi:trans-AT polyketide synthase/acyltransferase/oxidoreductase domain-containing protein
VITIDSLGSSDFKREHGVRYAYVAGSMVRGIASVPVVVSMARAGFLGYFGTGALTLETIEKAILDIKAALGEDQPWGMNLLSNAATPQAEMDTVDLFLRHGVRRVEASAYMQISPALVKYRAKGLRRDAGGRIRFRTLLLAKLSRPEIATLFLSPAPEKIVAALLRDGEITAEEADLARSVPMADDICVEADSGGHTDMGTLSTLLPTIRRLRDELAARHDHPKPVRVGGAGGIGTPEAAATAFVLGADFVLTGSINQCTVEAGTSDAAKDLLQQINVQDTDYCPSGSLFELGAKTQVVKKSVFFPARANKLYDLWRTHDSLDAIDPKTLAQIEEKYFKRSLDAVWAETRAFYLRAAPDEVAKAEANPKHKMALIFRWYFVHTMRLAIDGSPEQKVDYQIHCGPALGAFNQWVRGTELENWRHRRVADIALRLLEATAEVLNQRFSALSAPETATAKAVGV